MVRVLLSDSDRLYSKSSVEAGHFVDSMDYREVPNLDILRLHLTAHELEYNAHAMETVDGGPLAAFIHILEVMQTPRTIRLEIVFEVEGSLDWEHWHWPVLESALILFGECHDMVTLELVERPHLFQLPRPFSLDFARRMLAGVAKSSHIMLAS